jgi:hypothetical protein
MKPYKGLAGIIVGSLLIVAGALMIAFPKTAIFLPFANSEDFTEPVSLLRLTQENTRIYGFLGLILGATFIWVARWPRWTARRAAIEGYVWLLSQELSKRLGTKPFYSFEHVIRIASESSCNMAFIPYAHAMFCSRPDFEASYASSKLASSYEALRNEIARLYFDGTSGFDAATVIRLATPPKPEEYDFYQGTDG